MTAGELFIKLGLKGADDTAAGLGKVDKGLGSVKSSAIEAKVAVLAAVYALQQMTAKSGQQGTGLTNFTATLGVAAKTLQQYQYAARQMGVTNEEVEDSFRSLQETMTKAVLGQGAPAGLARLAQLTGPIGQRDLEKFSKNPEALLQRLQEYAGKETNAGLRNEVIKSFGVGDNMTAALTRQAFSQKALKKAPTYNDKEISQLDKANIAWSNLGNKIEMAIGHLNAAHGGQLVGDISKIVTQVLKLVDALANIAEKLKIFQAIGKVFEGWSSILGGVNSAIDAVSGAASDPKKRAELGNDVGSFVKEAPGIFAQMGGSLLSGLANGIDQSSSFIANSILPTPKDNQKSGSNQKIEINQNLNFQHDGKDHSNISNSVKKSVKDAYRQISAQGQGA